MSSTPLRRALRTLCRGALLVVAGACLSGAMVLGYGASLAVAPPRQAAPISTAAPVTSERSTPTPVVSMVETPRGEAGELAPTHVLADIRDMDVASNGIVSPPDFEHIFRVHGLPDGPVWLAAHARSDGREPAPGNSFLTFAVGDRVEALGAAWRVTERWSASKDDAEVQGPLADPAGYAGDLIIVSCLPRAGRAATSNTWLVAEPTPD